MFYPVSKQKDFVDSHAHLKVFSAGNQCGKTSTLAFEESLHLTGYYPDWWKGVKHDGPIKSRILGGTCDRVRDTIQERMLEHLGDSVLDAIYHPCIKGLITHMKVKHKSGGVSEVDFKAYEQGYSALQMGVLDRIAMDEDPDNFRIVQESWVRLLRKNGYLSIAYTPLPGSTLEDDLTQSSGPAPEFFFMGWEDLPWGYSMERIREEMGDVLEREPWRFTGRM